MNDSLKRELRDTLRRAGWPVNTITEIVEGPDDRRFQAALAAMQGLVSPIATDNDLKRYAALSVKAADALLAALTEGETK